MFIFVYLDDGKKQHGRFSAVVRETIFWCRWMVLFIITVEPAIEDHKYSFLMRSPVHNSLQRSEYWFCHWALIVIKSQREKQNYWYRTVMLTFGARPLYWIYTDFIELCTCDDSRLCDRDVKRRTGAVFEMDLCLNVMHGSLALCVTKKSNKHIIPLIKNGWISVI